MTQTLNVLGEITAVYRAPQARSTRRCRGQSLREAACLVYEIEKETTYKTKSNGYWKDPVMGRKGANSLFIG